MRCPRQLRQNLILNAAWLDAQLSLSGNRGYDSNRSVPFRAFTRHHREFLHYGNAIQSRRERGCGQPVPVTQRGSIPTNNSARRAAHS